MSNQEKKSTAVAERKPTIANRFTNEVKRQFQGAVGRSMDLDEHQKQLMTNVFIKADSALEEHEARRQQDGKDNITPYTWDNVDMQKLALDAMHRIRLGLDALIDNHIHPVPYINRKTRKYDLDLRIGYKGKLYYRKQVALHPVKDVRIELVHENDDFTVTKKSGKDSVEDYTFKINDPFNRGEVKGGFGYIIYEDEERNEMVIVTKDDFDKSKNAAQSRKFWGPWEERMQLKTLTHRVAEKIEIDPRKVNQSFHYVEAQDNPYKEELEVQQPTDRQTLDFEDEAPEVETSTDSTNGNSEVEDSTNGEPEKNALDREALMAEITPKAKELWPGEWIKHLKATHRDINPDSDTMMDLSDTELLELHDVVMSLEVETEEA